MVRIYEILLAHELKDGKMQYVTSVERIGYQRGLQEGQQQGIQHVKNLIARMIAKKFKSEPEHELARMEKLILDDLLELGELLFDLETLDAVHDWVVKRSETS